VLDYGQCKCATVILSAAVILSAVKDLLMMLGHIMEILHCTQDDSCAQDDNRARNDLLTQFHFAPAMPVSLARAHEIKQTMPWDRAHRPLLTYFA